MQKLKNNFRKADVSVEILCIKSPCIYCSASTL